MKNCPSVFRLRAQPGTPRAHDLPIKKASRTASVLSSILLLCAALTLPTAAIADMSGTAGGADSKLKFNVVISDGVSDPWMVDMKNILNYDVNTGDITMPVREETTPAASWAWDKIVDPATGNEVDGLKWHTPERLDPTGASDSTNPWKSTFTFNANGNVDPFMNYVFAAKNNTNAPLTYTFTYGEALIPSISGLYDVSADIVGGLTNAPGTGSVKVSPVFLDIFGDNDGVEEIQILRLSTDGGITFVNAGVDVGLAQEESATGASGYNLYYDELSAIATTPFNYWEITTQFTLSPKDTAVFTGSVLINPSEANIPEPSTYALLLGAIALGFTAMQRRRAAA